MPFFWEARPGKRHREVRPTIYPVTKCTYHLDPFDVHFDPHKHNGYYMRRTALLKGPKRTKYLRVHAEFNSQTPQEKERPKRLVAIQQVFLMFLVTVVIPVGIVFVQFLIRHIRYNDGLVLSVM